MDVSKLVIRMIYIIYRYLYIDIYIQSLYYLDIPEVTSTSYISQALSVRIYFNILILALMQCILSQIKGWSVYAMTRRSPS